MNHFEVTIDGTYRGVWAGELPMDALDAWARVAGDDSYDAWCERVPGAHKIPATASGISFTYERAGEDTPEDAVVIVDHDAWQAGAPHSWWTTDTANEEAAADAYMLIGECDDSELQVFGPHEPRTG